MLRRVLYVFLFTLLGVATLLAAHFLLAGFEEGEGFLKATDWINLVYVLVFVAFFFYYRIRPGAGLGRMRALPAVDELEDVVGRAAETGRPILFIPGQLAIKAMSNVAGMEYMRALSRLCARYQVPIKMVARDGSIIAAAREVARWVYEEELRPDLFRPDDFYLLSPDQFCFAASASMLMFRERPAAIVLFGFFRAESLLLLESARASGATVIGATDEPTQMPFFIACCHYPMIGEELYAAGPLAADTPLLRATVRVTDMWRLAAIGFMLAGTALAGLAHFNNWTGLSDFLKSLAS